MLHNLSNIIKSKSTKGRLYKKYSNELISLSLLSRFNSFDKLSKSHDNIKCVLLVCFVVNILSQIQQKMIKTIRGWEVMISNYDKNVFIRKMTEKS